MAILRYSETWNGIPRTFTTNAGSFTLETCYALYANEDEGTAFLRINGLSVYAESPEELEAALPLDVLIEVGVGHTYRFYIPENIRSGAYSPSGNWMKYYAVLSAGDEIGIPTTGEPFIMTIHIESDELDESFIEQACSPKPNTLSTPDIIYTGRAYAFTTGTPLPVDAYLQNSGSLIWYPKQNNVYTTQIYERGYVDEQTLMEDASSSFSTFYFAVPNRDNLPGSEAASFLSDAQIAVRTKYLSGDFTDGILVGELSANVPCAPRDEVDSSLAPVLTSSDITLRCDDDTYIINDKYVHRHCIIEARPVAQYKYGDTLAYIRQPDGSNHYSSFITFPAVGVLPGESYVNPETGETETATEESTAAVSMSVCGSKWGLFSGTAQKTYDVLYYASPRFTSLAVHRASTSGSSTEWQYNGTYYKKDDYGTYCIIEYTVEYSSLDSENEVEMMIQYGTHRQNVTPPTSGGSGFIVVNAGTSAMDIIGVLYDTVYPYGISNKIRLSTNGIMMDFLAGGKGIAIGKPATVQNALDIADAWKLLFYQATVRAYNGTSEADLVSWMHDVDARLTALENS